MEDNNYTTKSAGGVIIGLIILTIIGWWIYNSVTKTGSWTGYYYPNPPDYSNSIRSNSNFKSLDECRNWVNQQVSTDIDDNYDYQCGMDCSYEPNIGEEVCKEDAQ